MNEPKQDTAAELGNIVQARAKGQQAWLDVTEYDHATQRFTPELYEFRTVYVGNAQHIDEHLEFQKYKSNRGEAANYESDGLYRYSTTQAEFDAWAHRATLVPPMPTATHDYHIGVSVEPAGTHVQVWDGDQKLYEQFHEAPAVAGFSKQPVPRSVKLVQWALVGLLVLAGIACFVLPLRPQPDKACVEISVHDYLGPPCAGHNTKGATP